MQLIVNSLQPFGASGLGGLWYDVGMAIYIDIYKRQITRLEVDNAIKEIKEKELKDRIKELEEIVHNALNDKRFNIKLAVLSVSIKLIFGLVGLYIAVYRNDVITHALVHAFQHYCM